MLKLKIRLPESFLQRQSTKDDTEMGEASVFAETSMKTICHTEFIEVSHDERSFQASTSFRLYFKSPEQEWEYF
jgi:hypothetical protein